MVALGPGQHVGAAGVGGLAFAGGEVVQPGPGRHLGGGSAVVVAAAVVEVPAQVRRGELLAGEVVGKRNGVELPELHVGRRQVQGNAEGVAPIAPPGRLELFDQREKPGKLRLLGRGYAQLGNEAGLPVALDVEPVLGVVAEVVVVVDGPPVRRVASQGAGFLQKVEQLTVAYVGHGQVVGAPGVGRSLVAPRGGVAAQLRLQLYQQHVGLAVAVQPAPGRQPRHAPADNQHVSFEGVRGSGNFARVAQQVADSGISTQQLPLNVVERGFGRAAFQQCGGQQSSRHARPGFGQKSPAGGGKGAVGFRILGHEGAEKQKNGEAAGGQFGAYFFILPK
jgi:hypothetical protein